MKLIKIPENKYYDYRLNAMFNCYKWDPQFYDNNTLAKYVLVLSKAENEEVDNLYVSNKTPLFIPILVSNRDKIRQHLFSKQILLMFLLYI